MREKDEGTFRAGPGVRGGKRGRVWNKGTKTLICSRSNLSLPLPLFVARSMQSSLTEMLYCEKEITVAALSFIRSEWH